MTAISSYSNEMFRSGWTILIISNKDQDSDLGIEDVVKAIENEAK